MPDPVALDSDGNDAAMWHALLDIADRQPGEWTIVGALMVALHCAESGVPRLRATRDLDAVVEVRGVAGATARFAELLATLGWDIADEDVGGEGIGRRFTKGWLTFDLLAPEGIGRADLTTRKPLKTVEIPGGTRALRRTSHVPVTVRGRTGTLPRPDLLGALVVKSCAAVADRGSDGKNPQRHVDDLAHLYARVPDPRQVAAAATARDRKRLSAAPEPTGTLSATPPWPPMAAPLAPSSCAPDRPGRRRRAVVPCPHAPSTQPHAGPWLRCRKQRCPRPRHVLRTG